MNTKVKIKAENLVEFLKTINEDLDKTFTFDLDLEISKTTIKILDNYCEDWEFTSEQPTKEREGIKSKPSEIYEDGSESYYTSGLGIKDYNSIAILVEAIFRLSKNSPNIKFESGLFYNTLEVEYNLVANSPVSVEHSLLTMIIETYYGNGVSIKEAINDTVGKLRGMWLTKEICNHPNTTSLTKILYGNGRS